MNFEIPKGLTTTEMCIYIDNNVYKGEIDEYKIYSYIYNIVRSVCLYDNKFNIHGETLDDFCIFMSNRVYMRLVNPKQFKLNENGQPLLPKIKSVKNYINANINKKFYSFKEERGSSLISRKSKEVYDDTGTFNTLLASSIDNIYLTDFKLTTKNIPLTIEKFLETLPYPKDSYIWNNIYISVCLTFNNTITPTYENFSKMVNKTQNLKSINNAFIKFKYAKPVLYHLPDSMSNYIDVLVKQVKNIIKEDLRDIIHTKNVVDYDVGCFYNYYNGNEDFDDNKHRDN